MGILFHALPVPGPSQPDALADRAYLLPDRVCIVPDRLAVSHGNNVDCLCSGLADVARHVMRRLSWLSVRDNMTRGRPAQRIELALLCVTSPCAYDEKMNPVSVAFVD